MADSTGPVIIAGSITAANELFFEPGAGLSKFNWRIIPATAGLALALAGLEKAAPKFAVGLAWLAVGTVLLVPLGSGPTPLENANKLLGYTKGVTQ